MKFIASFMLFASILCAFSMSTHAEVVIRDEGIEITRSEFRAALEMSPQLIRELATNDLGERYELISRMLEVRKLAAKADVLSTDTPGYWELQFQLLALKRQFIYDRELKEVTLPDPHALAQEYYKTQKDKYATKPETRLSSHILLASPPGLPREGVRAKAQELLNELRSGADFEAMVEEYSNDPGSKKRKGSFNRFIKFGEKGVTPPYSEALFEIAEIGEYSEITDSEFGIHIIRLDDIEEGGYYDFETVKDAIYRDISAEFRLLASKEINGKYSITEEAFIDGQAMEELFAPYQAAQ